MKRQRQAGFTLIELVAVIVIMGIISVVTGRILLASFNTFITSQNISEIDWNGLLTMEVFTNDVHDIRSANDISTINATSFSFVNSAGTSVSYALSGSTLLRNSAVLASGVQSVAFDYRDTNYVATATPGNVRYILLTVNFTQNNLTLPFATMAGTRGMS